MNSLELRSNRHAGLTELRRRIRRIEGHTSKGTGLSEKSDAVTIGPPFICQDKMLPVLHELVAGSYLDWPAARDFALALIAGLMRQALDQAGMVLWCQRQKDRSEFGQLYGPGLKALGLPPDRFLMVTGKKDADCLWAMEQGLASRSLLAVIGAVDHVGLIASRRLSLAASVHRTFCFLLPIQPRKDPSAARIRWRIESANSQPDYLDLRGLGRPTWHLTLERSLDGQTGHWTVEWDYATHYFHLVSKLGNQPAGRPSSPKKQGADVIAFDRTG